MKPLYLKQFILKITENKKYTVKASKGKENTKDTAGFIKGTKVEITHSEQRE